MNECAVNVFMNISDHVMFYFWLHSGDVAQGSRAVLGEHTPPVPIHSGSGTRRDVQEVSCWVSNARWTIRAIWQGNEPQGRLSDRKVRDLKIRSFQGRLQQGMAPHEKEQRRHSFQVHSGASPISLTHKSMTTRHPFPKLILLICDMTNKLNYSSIDTSAIVTNKLSFMEPELVKPPRWWRSTSCYRPWAHILSIVLSTWVISQDKERRRQEYDKMSKSPQNKISLRRDDGLVSRDIIKAIIILLKKAVFCPPAYESLINKSKLTPLP